MADEVEPKKKKSKLKLVIIIVIAVLLLSIVAVALWWFMLRTPSADVPLMPIPQVEQKEEADLPSQTKMANIPRTITSTVSLPTVTVNLLDQDVARYLRISMDVEVSTEEAKEEIEANSARIRDSIIILLSSKTYAELATTEGKMQLKNEVTTRLNQILGIPRVVRVYFTEFFVQ